MCLIMLSTGQFSMYGQAESILPLKLLYLYRLYEMKYYNSTEHVNR